MIPRTYPSIVVNGETAMTVNVLTNVSGLTQWIDYIPVKSRTDAATVINSYSGALLASQHPNPSAATAWIDYIPVYVVDYPDTQEWRSDNNGFIPLFGINGWTPELLFSNGEQGVWYDPSDLTTLFTDSAGTTPVAPPGNGAAASTVGLMLDKSRGLVLGSELAASANISTNWSQITGSHTFAADDGAVKVTCTSTGIAQVSLGTVAVGKFYAVSYQIRVSATATVPTSFTSITTGPTSVNVTATAYETRTGYFSPSSANAVNLRLTLDTGEEAWVRSISVRELPGNHAYQTTLANRPTLSAKYNLLEQTEDFANAYWTKTNLTIASGVTDPDGGTTAFTFTAGAANATISRSVGTQVQGSRISIWLRRRTGTGTVALWVGNLYQTVALTSSWELFELTQAATSALFLDIRLSTSGDAVDAWHPDLRVANESSALPPYQRVVDALTYDTVGFPNYLLFDNDALVTNSIDFTATDEMSVFAGVRKLSDTAQGSVVELSNDPVSTNGSFSLLAPGTAGATFRYGSRGTTFTQAVTSAIYASPLTTVLTGQSDISGDSTVLRINALQDSVNTGDQGTGNYGNYPLYIGARAGTSLYYNGRLHSLIVLGRTVTATELTQTEGYVETKTFGKDMNYVYTDELLGPDGEQLLVTAGGEPLFMTVSYE